MRRIYNSVFNAATTGFKNDIRHTFKRYITIPHQIKAYGGDFLPAGGQRFNMKATGTLVLGSNILVNTNAARSPQRHKNYALESSWFKTNMTDSFETMPLLAKKVRLALNQELKIFQPSPIQQLVIDVALKKLESGSISLTQSNNARQAIVALGPSGSGKTLACIAPAFSSILEDRDVYSIPVREFRPRMIILTATKELSEQIGHVCNLIGKHCNIKTQVIKSKKRSVKNIGRLLKKNSPADVLVMSPSRVLEMIRSRRLFIEDLRYVMIDEADTLISAEHSHAVPQFLAKVHKRNLYRHLPPVNTQIFFATSCMTRKLAGYLTRLYPTAIHCWTRDAHRVPPQIKILFMPYSKLQEKVPLLEHILGTYSKNYPVIEAETSDELERLPPQKRGIPEKEQLKRVTLKPALTSYPDLKCGRKICNQSFMNKRYFEKNESNTEVQEEDSENVICSIKNEHFKDNRQGHSNNSTSIKPLENNSKAIAAKRFKFGLSDYTVERSGKINSRGYANPKSRYPDLQNSLKTHVSRALEICTSREHKQSGSICPSIRWFNLITHASPFTFHCPQTFIPGSGLRVIIFCSTISTSAAIYYTLQDKGYNATLMHSFLPRRVRDFMIKYFASGKSNILVCTDICARGIDLPVDIIINFNMPHDAVTFLTRAGRVGRMGRPGTVYNIYSKKHERVIASAISSMVNNGLALNDVANFRYLMMTPRYREWAAMHKNKLSRAYVTMIAKKTLSSKVEKMYVKHNALWRPIWKPKTVGFHGGVPLRQQNKLMANVYKDAIWYRREQLANRKSGKAKFGRINLRSIPWSWKEGVASSVVAGEGQTASNVADGIFVSNSV